MKLGSFEITCQTGTQRRVGVLVGESLVDVTAAEIHRLERKGVGTPESVAERLAPPSMLSFLRTGGRALEAARTAAGAFRNGDLPETHEGRRIVYDRTEVSLLSPLSRPNSIKDCTVYEQHLLNSRDIEQGALPDAYYDYPVYYKGNPDAVVHPGEEVEWPAYSEKLDFELEIAAVIGREGRDIDAADAESYIAGFTVFNDFSARDTQAEAKPVMMGPSKSKDFANGFGPWLVTADSIDPTALETTVRVDGEVWSTGDTGGMYHSWGDILEHLSAGITIHPGDVVGSGTVPLGCGLELGRWLKPGDTLELQVEGIGTLTHRIGEKPA